MLGGRADGPAGDFDRRCRRYIERIEHLTTPVDAIVDAERAEVREGNGAGEIAPRERREAVRERDGRERGHVREAIKELVERRGLDEFGVFGDRGGFAWVGGADVQEGERCEWRGW